MSADAHAVPATVTDVELAASEDAAALVDRMTSDLGLWETDVEAGLFLVALAVALDEEPVPPSERGEAEVTLGPLSEAGDAEELDQLAILGVIDDGDRELAEALDAELPGWIEAGADLLAPRLEGKDAVEATAEIADIVRDID